MKGYFPVDASKYSSMMEDPVTMFCPYVSVFLLQMSDDASWDLVRIALFASSMGTQIK